MLCKSDVLEYSYYLNKHETEAISAIVSVCTFEITSQSAHALN